MFSTKFTAKNEPKAVDSIQMAIIRHIAEIPLVEC